LNTQFIIENEREVDSPAILVYPAIVEQNIRLAIQLAGGPGMIRPHVKTHKMIEVSRMLIDAGILKFKCATIAEVEMLVMAGATDILLAYQPTLIKARRLIILANANPGISFGYLIDNELTVQELANYGMPVNTHPWIDINVGMNRTGVGPGKVLDLYRLCKSLPGFTPAGLHAYDGHIHETDTTIRYAAAASVYKETCALRDDILRTFDEQPVVVLGGTPCFPFYAAKPDVETSPGTFVFWDEGYRKMLPDMKFDVAAVLLTRVISIIDKHTICLDLGHKSVAPEGPLPRVYFPEHPEVKVLGQSEEHLVVEVADSSAHKPGDAWYGIPAHICPTIALYDRVQVVRNQCAVSSWKVVARDRMITV